MVSVSNTGVAGALVFLEALKQGSPLQRANARVREIASAILAAPLESYGARWAALREAVSERARIAASVDYGPRPGAMPFLAQLDDPRDVALRASLRARIDELSLGLLRGDAPPEARVIRERLRDLDARYPLAQKR